MTCTAWKDFKKGDDFVYVIQLDGIRGKREENRMRKYFESWRYRGDGYDPSNKVTTLFFHKMFPSEDEWKSWARSFPHILVEVGKSGKRKPYKLGFDYINSPRRKKNV
jgi:hypothetical protein